MGRSHLTSTVLYKHENLDVNVCVKDRWVVRFMENLVLVLQSVTSSEIEFDMRKRKQTPEYRGFWVMKGSN